MDDNVALERMRMELIEMGEHSKADRVRGLSRVTPGLLHDFIDVCAKHRGPVPGRAGKEAVSGNYTAEQLALHGDKRLRSIQGRRALVIGSDRRGNIGNAIASRLGKAGMWVSSPDRSELDALDRESMWDAISVNDIDTLILANGYTWQDWIEDAPSHQIDQVLNDSLRASIHATQVFARCTMDRSFRKQIVFIGSMAYRSVLNASAVYCAAKAGLAHFARCIAWELAPKAFDVYCVHPGNTEHTPMAEATIEGIMRYRGLGREAAEAYWGAVNPRGKWLQSADIADVVYGLCAYNMAAGQLSGGQIELAGGQR